jgi:cysteinyl-tRNA synthetase
MKPQFEAILKSLPAQVPRSRLHPYGELIREMRKRKRSYREITEVLREQFGLKSGISTVRDFLRAQTKSKTKHRERDNQNLSTTRNRKELIGTNKEREALAGTTRQQKAFESTERRFQESMQSRLSKPANKPRFEYNSEEPLRIFPKEGKRHD